MKTKGISFIEGLQLLFIAYQLAGVIAWPWWCVVLPMIVKFVLTFVIKTIEAVEKRRNGKQ